MNFRLLGTTAATVIALSTPMGAASDTWSPPVSGNGAGTLYKINDLAEPVAPCAVEVGISGITGMGVEENISNTWVRDPAVHDIFWKWTVLGQSAETFEQSANLQLLPHEDNKWVGYGKSCSFDFTTGGTYTVQCEGLSITGETLTETFQVTIRSGDTEYPNGRTICVSTSNNFTGAPAGSTQVTSIAAAQAAAEALNGQTHRIMFRYGDTFIGTYTIDNSIVNARLTGFGTRADGKPVWTMDSRANHTAIVFGNGNLCQDFVEHDIDFRGLWDPTTQGGYPDFVPCETATHNTVANTCMATINCEFGKMKSKRFGANVPGYKHIVLDCFLYDWRDYGAWAQAFGNTSDTSFLSFRGVAILHNPDAMVNNVDKLSGLTNDHGPGRIADTQKVLIRQCNFYSAASWGQGVQPGFRLAQVGSSGETTYGWHNEMYATNIEGGGISCTAQNNNSPTFPGNHLFDAVRTFGSWANFGYHFLMGHGGVTIRNHVGWQFGVGSLQAFYLLGIDNDGSGGGLSASTARCDVVNNTLIDLATSGWGNTVFGEGDRSSREVADIVTYQPNGGTVSHTGLVEEGYSFVPRNRGRRVGPHPSSTNIPAVANGVSVDLNMPSGMLDGDYDVGGEHILKVGGVAFAAIFNDFTVTKVDNNTVRLTNTSGVTWPSGTARLSLVPTASLLADNEKYGTDTSYASDPSVTIPRPGAGSNATGTGSSSVFLPYDALGATRSGARSVGAVAPA